MGLYDSVWMPCKKCGHEIDFQSKAGDCLMYDYKPTGIPYLIAREIHESGYVSRCRECGERFRAMITPGSLEDVVSRTVPGSVEMFLVNSTDENFEKNTTLQPIQPPDRDEPPNRDHWMM